MLHWMISKIIEINPKYIKLITLNFATLINVAGCILQSLGKHAFLAKLFQGVF